jgi:hypothetical protein
LRNEVLKIRITSIDNRYKNRSEFHTVPMCDNILYQHDMRFGENHPVYCVEESISNPELYKEAVNRFSDEVTDHINGFIGENCKKVNNLMLRRQKS